MPDIPDCIDPYHLAGGIVLLAVVIGALLALYVVVRDGRSEEQRRASAARLEATRRGMIEAGRRAHREVAEAHLMRSRLALSQMEKNDD